MQKFTIFRIGDETFGIEPASYDEAGKLLIQFPKSSLSADAAGVVTLAGGPSVFVFAIPLGESVLKLTIDPTLLRTTLAPSTP